MWAVIPYSYGFPVGHPPMGSFLGVPIVIRGEPYGNLYLTEKEGGVEFTESDEDAAMLLADFAGVAIDHARQFTGSEAQRTSSSGPSTPSTRRSRSRARSVARPTWTRSCRSWPSAAERWSRHAFS